MNTLPFIFQLREKLPQADWSWVVSALRQDVLVWESLQDPNFGEKALHSLGGHTQAWSPAHLSLLALEIDQTPDAYQVIPMIPLKPSLKKQALKLLEEVKQGNQPVVSGAPSQLAQAGLLALALREGLRSTGSLKNIKNELHTAGTDWFPRFQTSLTCLYGLIPEPIEMLKEFLLPDAGQASINAGLHMLLSNPLSIQEHLSCLLQAVPAEPSAALPMLRELAQRQSQLAQMFAETLIDCAIEKPPLIRSTAHEDSWDARLNTLSQHVYLAELHLVAEKHQKSAELIKEIQVQTAELLDNMNLLYEVAVNGSSKVSLIPESKLATANQAVLDGNWNQAHNDITNIIQEINKNGPLPSFTITPLRAATIQNWTENMFKAAEILYKLGYYHKVIETTRLLLAYYPCHLGALSLLGKSLSNTQDCDAAVQILGIATTLAPEQLDLRRSLALSLEAKHDWQPALQERRAIVEQIWEEDPLHQTPDLHSLANCALKAGELENAIQICQQVLTFDPQDGAAHAILGQALYELHHAEEGLEHLDQATQLAPHLVSPWLAVANIRSQQSGPQQAIQTLRTAILAAPDEAELHLVLAEALEAVNSLTESEAALLQAYKLLQRTPRTEQPVDPDLDLRISLTLGRLHRQLGRKEQALEVLEKAYTTHFACGKIRHSQIAYSFAQALLDMDQAKQALPILEILIQEGPDTASPYVDYAKALLVVGENPDSAAAALHIALQKEPDFQEAKALLAEAYGMAGKHKNAIVAYQSALETDLSSNPDWLARLSYGLGKSAQALGQSEIAIAALQEAVNTQPEIPSYQRSLAEAYWEAELFSNAFHSAEAALQLDDKNIEMLSWFARLSAKLYERLSSSSPYQDQDKDISKDQTVGLKPKQILHEALNALTLATTLAPERDDLLLELGRFEILAGEKRNAGNVLHKLLSLSQVTTTILEETAGLFSKLNDKQGTVASLERAIDQDSGPNVRSPQLMIKLANAHEDNGSPSMALKTLVQAAVQFPDDISIYQHQTQLLLELDQPEQALEMLMNGLQVVQDEGARAAILYLAAPLQQGMGNLAEALRSADKMLTIARVTPLPARINLAYHTLAADLLFSAIQDEQARACLDECKTSPAMDAMEDEGLVYAWENFHCLKAEIALEAGEEINTAGNLNQALQKNPHSIRSLSLQARLLARNGDHEHAQSIYQEALDRLPVTYSLTHGLYPGIKELIALSQAAFELEDWGLAYDLAIKAVSLSPHDIQAHLNLARQLVQQAEYQHLCQELHAHQHGPGKTALQDQNLKAFTQEIETSQNLVKILVKEFEIDHAVDQGWDVFNLTSQPACLSRWQVRGQIVFGVQPADQSTTSIHTINALVWSSFNWTADDHSSRLSAVRKYALDEQVAQHETQLALKSYPKDLKVLMWTIQVFSTLDPEAALATSILASNLLSPKPGSLSALIYAQQAGLMHQQAKQESAKKAIESCLTIWSDEPHWHYLAAKIIKANSEEQENIEKAITHLEKAIQLLEHEPAYHLELGQIYLATKAQHPTRLDKAIHAFQTAVQLSPEDFQAWFWLAQAHFYVDTQTSLHEALDCADRALRLIETNGRDGSNSRPYLLRADIALKLGNAEDALSFTAKAAQINPNEAYAVLLHIKALEALDQPIQALAAVEQAIPLMEKPLLIQLKQIELVQVCQGLPVALRMINELAENHQSEPAVLYLLAQLLAKAGKPEAAIEAAQLCLKTQPSQEAMTSLTKEEVAALHHLIGKFFHELGQLDSAIHHLNEAIQLFPIRVEPYLELGKVYQKQRQLRKAHTTFEKATQAAPQDFRAFYAAGMSLKDGKDYMGAQSMLKRASELAPGEVQIRKQLAAVAALALVHNPQSSKILAQR